MEMQEMPDVSSVKGDDTEASKATLVVKSDAAENLEKETQELKGEEETDHYSKLQCPQEDIYSEAFYCDTSEFKKAGKQTPPTAGQIRAYKAATVVLTVLCALLLLATIILALKLCPVTQEGRSCRAEECKSVCPTVQPPQEVNEKVVCPVNKQDRSCSAEECKSVCPTVQPRREVTRIVQNGSVVCPVTKQDGRCTAEECKSVCPTVQPRREVIRRKGYLCHECPHGWLKFQEQCFYLSTTRLNWTLSQMNCSDSGGSLAVIDSREVQEFLTRKGKLDYWIGLEHNKVSTWVDNTVLKKSYWEDNQPHSAGCGVLSSSRSAGKNWKTQSCSLFTYFICQVQL